MTRALLQQALEALETKTYQGQVMVSRAIRAELAKPEQQERKPAWHDAPTCAGVWHVKTSRNHIVEIHASEATNGMAQTRWYGPIPNDGDTP